MLRKAMDVLALFTPDRSRIGVSEAAKLLGRPKSTVSRWLSAMEAAGFLRRQPATQLYHLGLRLATLGDLARASMPLEELARPMLHRLRDVTGETAILAIVIGAEAMNLTSVESPRPLRGIGQIGRKIPLHSTAAGKCLLAWCEESKIRALVGSSLEPFTSNSIRDVEQLLAELRAVRRRGYSTSRGEFEDHLVAVGAPVRESTEQVVAAVTIAAPASRLHEPEMSAAAQHVMEAANTLSEAMGWRNERNDSERRGQQVTPAGAPTLT